MSKGTQLRDGLCVGAGNPGPGRFSVPTRKGHRSSCLECLHLSTATNPVSALRPETTLESGALPEEAGGPAGGVETSRLLELRDLENHQKQRSEKTPPCRVNVKGVCAKAQ